MYNMSVSLGFINENESKEQDFQNDNHLSMEKESLTSKCLNIKVAPHTISKNVSRELLPLKTLKQNSSVNELTCGSSVISSSTNSKISTKKITNEINLQFENLSYKIKVGFLKKESKVILNGISGNFKSGELTAIIGPSGAGKSTLFNILSGYIQNNYTGNIFVNGYERNLKKFISQSGYITQDTELQPHITVLEAMNFAANLKMENNNTKSTKREMINKILQSFGMYEIRHTMTGKLSGGQKKRLSIALELVSNPPILFLDEPTSGLDSVTSTQCISLLKELAQDGRTIICTIHQPSALIFEMFDHLFAIAEGQCIYAGGTQNLVAFLSEIDLKCPESHNPSDFLLEISTHNYGIQNPKLIEKILNGKCELYRKIEKSTKDAGTTSHAEKSMESITILPLGSSLTQMTKLSSSTSTTKKTDIMKTSTITCSKDFNIKNKLPNIQIDPTKLCQINTPYAASFQRQIIILLMRMFLILWRDKSLLLMRIILHALMGVFIGILYYGIGNDARHTFNNLRYIFFSIMFVMYTAFSSMLLNFPLEFSMVSREHFNRWYSLKAYYIAMTLADIPIQLLCTSIFLLISYVLTAQPLELIRFLLFSLMVFMAALVAQSIGLSVGACMNVKNAAIFGPFFLSPFLAFSGFFVQIKDVAQIMHWLFHISFLKYSLEGSTLAIFGFDRPKLQCKDMFCMFIHPQRFLKEMCMDESSYEFSLCALLVIFLILRILSFYIMSIRLHLFK